MSKERLAEIASQARAFSPDPFDGYFPTYQRLVYLNSLYDIALGFEHSPMMGCTSFVATGPATVDGHTILARNFDFESGQHLRRGQGRLLRPRRGQDPLRLRRVAWAGRRALRQ
jgi:isopenicillin-N N-acyltransferase-like protein